MMRRFLVILALVLSAADVAKTQSPPWTGIIDPSRAVDWRNAGCCINLATGAHIPIPTRPQCQLSAASPPIGNQVYIVNNAVTPSGNTDQTDATTINQALQACGAPAAQATGGICGPAPPGCYVLLGPGKFYVVNGLTFGAPNNPNGFTTTANNVTLRGSGPDQTLLQTMTLGAQECGAGGNAICVSGGAFQATNNQFNAYGGGCSWTGSSYLQGTTTLTLSGCVYSTGNAFPQPGQIVMIDQRNDDIQLLGCTSSGTNATCQAAMWTLPPEWQVTACVGLSLGAGSANNTQTNNANAYGVTLLAPQANPTGSTTLQSCVRPITAVTQGSPGVPATFSYTLPCTLPAGTPCGTNLPAYTQCSTSAPQTVNNAQNCMATIDTNSSYATGVPGVTASNSIGNGRQCPDQWFNGSAPGSGRAWMPTCQGSWNSGTSTFTTGSEVSFRSEVQMARVATSTTTDGINGTITIDAPGIYATNYRATRAPGVYWYTVSPPSPVIANAYFRHDVGIESLTIDGTLDTGNTSGGHIQITRCYNCWVRNIRSIAGSRSHIWLTNAVWHTTVRDSYLYSTKRGASQSYGIELFDTTGDLLLENNMSVNGGTLLMAGGTTGTVFSYNFTWNDNALNPIYFLGAANYPNHDLNGYNLLEGNDTTADTYDNIHGTVWGPTTHFRERLRGAQVVFKNNNLTTFINSAYNRFPNIIGNVLGTAAPTINPFVAYHKLQNTSTGCGSNFGTSSATIYCSNGDSQNFTNVPDDVLVGQGMLRWGNYDVLTGAVRWCGVGTETGCQTQIMPGNLSGSEIPHGYPPFINNNPVPANHTLPPSFYLSAAPSWFTTKFGTVPFPPIGPDVTGGNAPDGTCWPGDPAHPMLVLPPVVTGTCTDAGSGMSYSIPIQLVHANLALDTALDTVQTITNATWASPIATFTGTFIAPNSDPVLVQGVNSTGGSTGGFNGTFQVGSASYPSPDASVLYPVSPAAGGSFPPGLYGVIETRVNSNGETTQSGSQALGYPYIASTCPTSGSCSITVTAPCGTVPPPATNPGINPSCGQQGWGADASTGWNVYIRRTSSSLSGGVIADTTGKWCRQNATPLPYGVAATISAFIDPMNPATGTCITPPTHSTASGHTITVTLPLNPGTYTSGGTLTSPTVQIFNADIDFTPGGPSPPTINSFTVSPTSITSGQSATLSWTTSGATSANISPTVGTVATSGSVSVSPTTTTTYTLTATNGSGSTTATATLTVGTVTTAIASFVGFGTLSGGGKLSTSVITAVAVPPGRVPPPRPHRPPAHPGQPSTRPPAHHLTEEEREERRRRVAALHRRQLEECERKCGILKLDQHHEQEEHEK